MTKLCKDFPIDAPSDKVTIVTIKEPTTFSAQNGHARCLLCGERNPWSLKLDFKAGESGTVMTTFTGHSGLQGYDEVLHGGVIAALLDSAMTHCLFHHGVQGLTADLHIRYVHPVPFDATLGIKASIESSTPRMYRLRAELFHGNQIMAWAKAKFMQRSETNNAKKDAAGGSANTKGGSRKPRNG